jgi:hypothetical protein
MTAITYKQFKRLKEMIWSSDTESIFLAAAMIDKLDDRENKLYLFSLRNDLYKQKKRRSDSLEKLKFRGHSLIRTNKSKVLTDQQLIKLIMQYMDKYLYDGEQTSWAMNYIDYLTKRITMMRSRPLTSVDIF